MIIAIDIRSLLDPFGGVAEYTRMIVESLLSLPCEHEYILFSNSHGTQRPRLHIPESARVRCAFFSVPNRVLNGLIFASGRPFLDDLIRQHTGSQIDIFFAPNVNFIAVSPKVKTILTVHDLSFEIYKDCLGRKESAWHMAVNPRNRMINAAHLIAVSGATKSDLETLYAIPSDRITVTHLAWSPEFSGDAPMPSRDVLGLPDRYIFALAGGGRKNCDTLIDAYALALKNESGRPMPYLVVAGADARTKNHLTSYAAKAGVGSYTHVLGTFPFSYRRAYYAYAELFIYPSLYEGFGIPPLEAAACGTPVIASAAGSVPEVMGTSALLVNPYNSADISRALCLLLTQKELQESYRQRGLEQAKKYEWKQCAEQTLKVFNTVCPVSNQ